MEAASAREDETAVNSWLGTNGSAAALGPMSGAGCFASVSLGRGPRPVDSDPGTDESFEARFAEQSDAVGRLCRRLLGRDGSAEDAVHEVFLRAQRGFSGYDPARPFRAWLLSITSHYCIDVLRRRSREGRIFQASDLEPGDLAGDAPSPLHHAIDAERRNGLLAAVEGLPSRYRVPLVLRYFQELDYQAIAETCGVSRDNVGVLLFRARRRLRDTLEEGDR